MALKKPTEVFMSFAADEKMLEDIRRSVDDIIRDLNLTTKEKNGILLAIEEACTNVIRHAYLFGPGTIRIKIKIYPTKVIFSIFDKGRRFEFDRVDTPDLDRYVQTGRKGGLGLYLIRKMMDSVDYFARDGENELRMVKEIKPRKQVVLKPRGMTIRLKFAIWASLVVFVLVGAIALYYNHRNTVAIEDRFFAEALNFAQTTALNASDKMVVGNELELAGLAKSALSGNPNLKYITIVDRNNIIWADVLNPQNFYSQYSPPPGVNPDKVGRFQHYLNGRGNEIYHLITNIKINDQVIGTVQLGFSKAALSKLIVASRQSILIFALLGLVVGLGAVYLLSYYFVKPIQRLTEGVLKIGQGNLEEALPVEGEDEFSEIARAFNEITTKFKKAQENVVEQERLQKEMQVAQEIQHALLPNRFPEIEGYELAAVYRAAKDVGGDYFDFVWIDKNTLGIAVADVSGKGVPGSLVMTMIRTAIRLEARSNYDPSNILAKVNDFVADDVKKGMFITMFFIILDSKNRQITFASAGHNPMILYRKDTDKCYFLNPKGMPLGLTLPDNISFGGDLQTDKLKLKKDDMLVVYTDGITEAMNNRSEQYGNDRLIEFIKQNAQLTPDEFAAALDKDLAQFTGNAPQNDDITLVVIKEKIMVDELILEKRKHLLEMVEVQGVPVEKACEEMGVSVSTFYKYRRRWKREGDAGLLNKRLRADEGIKQLSYNSRKALLEIVRENPEWGPAKLQRKMEGIGEEFSVKNIYDELVNMRLNTKKLRLAYVERIGSLKPEQKELLEKEILREAQKEVDRADYVEGLTRNIEKRQVEKITQETGRVISQLKQLSPNLKGDKLYDEIASGLEKLEGGKEIADMFKAMMLKVGDDLVEGQEPAAETAEAEKGQEKEESEKTEVIDHEEKDERPGTVDVAPISDEKIDINQKAIKTESQKSILDDIEEYEKRLLKKFKK
jgi:serine phosphatase RsbU (regulator of sigma subunit)/anti-sigma regulatory factor (Ser/Thr protein kinase)/transposase